MKQRNLWKTLPLLWLFGLPTALADVLALDEEQIQALGLVFAEPEVVAEVTGPAWPATVEAHPEAAMRLAAPVAGRIVRIHRLHGRVQAGEVLLELYSPAVAELQQQWLAVQARKPALEAGYKRAERLFKAGSSSRKQYLAARADWALLQQEEARWQGSLEALGFDGDALQGLRERGRADGHLPLRAPQTGVMMKVAVVPGQQVEAGTHLTEVVKLERVIAHVPVPVEQLPRIRHQGRARLRQPALEGEVAFVAPEVDPLTQRGMVHVHLNNPGGVLRPGQLVRVHFVRPLPAGGWRLPTRAVVDLNGRPALFVRTARGVEARPVELLHRDSEQAVVTALEGRPQVVVQGAIFLKGMLENAAGEDE